MNHWLVGLKLDPHLTGSLLLFSLLGVPDVQGILPCDTWMGTGVKA